MLSRVTRILNLLILGDWAEGILNFISNTVPAKEGAFPRPLSLVPTWERYNLRFSKNLPTEALCIPHSDTQYFFPVWSPALFPSSFREPHVFPPVHCLSTSSLLYA